MDAGGPRREFFRLLASQASESSFFVGREGKKFFANNILSVQVRPTVILLYMLLQCMYAILFLPVEGRIQDSWCIRSNVGCTRWSRISVSLRSSIQLPVH